MPDLESKRLEQIPSLQRFSGVVEIYDRYRPEPPHSLARILARYARIDRPRLVLDIGCGTGISTRYWSYRADTVIGIDPSGEMLRQAELSTTAGNISYRLASADQTGLTDACADIAVCANSLHWMEPQGLFKELERVLRPGGVFAAFYCNQYPLTGNEEMDQFIDEFRRNTMALDSKHNITTPARRSRREEHLSDMQNSGCFTATHTLTLRKSDSGNAERLIALADTNGFVRSLLKFGLNESEIGLDTLREDAERLLGDDTRPWTWNVDVWIGVR